MDDVLVLPRFGGHGVSTDDPLGGQGRVYFASPDGHPSEVTVGELSV